MLDCTNAFASQSVATGRLQGHRARSSTLLEVKVERRAPGAQADSSRRGYYVLTACLPLEDGNQKRLVVEGASVGLLGVGAASLFAALFAPR